MSAPQPGGENTLADWSVRRDRRLFYRTLTEYLGPGMEGGQYLCPVGKCTLDTESLGRRLLFQLKPDIRWAEGDATLTGYDVSRRLWVMADPADPAFCEDWAELFKGVAVQGATDVEVELRRPHVRPEALLQTLLVPYGEPLAADGPVPDERPVHASASPSDGRRSGNPRRRIRPQAPAETEMDHSADVVEFHRNHFPRQSAVFRGETDAAEGIDRTPLSARRATRFAP